MGASTSTALETLGPLFAPKKPIYNNDNDWYGIIIDGFMRDEIREYDLNNFPSDINKIIFMYYNKTRQFARYNPSYFKLSPDKTMITPIDHIKWGNIYMVYPLPNGYTKGVHQWTVKYVSSGLSNFNMPKTIGVTPVIYEEYLNETVRRPHCYNNWPHEETTKRGSHLEVQDWRVGQTVKVLLNMDIEGHYKTVEYHYWYRNKKKTWTGRINTKTNKKLYFAMCIHGYSGSARFQSVADTEC